MHASTKLFSSVLVVFGLACTAAPEGSLEPGGSEASRSGTPAQSGIEGEDGSSSTPATKSPGEQPSAPGNTTPSTGALVPARGGSSAGSGGSATSGVAIRQTADGVSYRLIVPNAAMGKKAPLLLVFSGTEGGATMAQNLAVLAQAVPSLGGTIRAVLDGVVYRGNGSAGASVLDDVRAKYDVDNDRTYLLGESAGTTAAFDLGFHKRQSFFAAYWANDVAATQADGPEKPASDLGFSPWGQVGPGGALSLAQAIAAKMKTAGYRTDSTTPYAGPGAGQHGAPDQLIAALRWLDGKAR